MFYHRRSSWSSWYQGEPQKHDSPVWTWTSVFSRRSHTWTVSFPPGRLFCWHRAGLPCVWSGFSEECRDLTWFLRVTEFTKPVLPQTLHLYCLPSSAPQTFLWYFRKYRGDNFFLHRGQTTSVLTWGFPPVSSLLFTPERPNKLRISRWSSLLNVSEGNVDPNVWFSFRRIWNKI